MLCYQDKTFCISPDCTDECGRQFTPKIKAEAEAWGKARGLINGAPVCFSYFCDQPTNHEGK